MSPIKKCVLYDRDKEELPCELEPNLSQTYVVGRSSNLTLMPLSQVDAVMSPGYMRQ